jgi:hypothetical protein
LGQALLQVLGMEESAAQRMAASIDWASTLLLPIPSEAATFSEVFVDGVSGVALTPLDVRDEGGLLWQKDGQIYILAGTGSIDQLLELASTLE